MNSNSPQLSNLLPSSDISKRVACIRCRTQKLKCIKSTRAADSSKCDRCRKADVACTYVPSKPMGRPKTSRSRQANRTMHCSASQPNELLDEATHPDTMTEDTEKTLDMQNMAIFFDDITPYDTTDASTKNDFAFSTLEMEFLTPCSSQDTGAMFSSSDTYAADIMLEDDDAIDFARPASSACDSEQGPRSSMQRLAKIGLDLHEQTTKYQKVGDSIVMQDLVSDVLRSSTEYLNCLLSLDETFISNQSSRFGNAWTDDGQPCQPSLQLDMSAAFQLLIPYVRLVQLHNTLYRTMLRYLGGSGSGSGGGNGNGSNGNGPSGALVPRSNFPFFTVGGTCVNASETFRARLLLHMNVDLLAEIEMALDLPHEARICNPQVEGGMGSMSGPMSFPLNGQGTCGLLRKAVSPRLLSTILEERNLGVDGIQSMRDSIACIKCFFRSTRHRPQYSL
ncbi:hypothetical protein COCMIDRAFT_98349 [Bipolaris oryzae ATCC 44560]|uniref:Zn(2)-C6 fungal-type domain-containing protein n=1 Tax=Bipolaris oryzae ATCC 44560 TaxID=930090 RepID=W6Z381_COCMI|nr:uncharacterized protein COCMIDRAFT_98349 [Bipolaris oryzae ATCC 44560]EUC44415.1 hypothetical protein COCMIDRAFT_98349 [Bipolaris oryzae ATCC 44560]